MCVCGRGGGGRGDNSKKAMQTWGRPHQLFLPSSFWDKITSMLIPDDPDDDNDGADAGNDHCDVDLVDDASQLRECN